MIKIEHLTKTFGSQQVFSDLSLDIPDNKTTSITGPSGHGKTTLLRIIAGLDNDYQGSVSGVPEKISFLFQEDRLLPWMNLRDNIEFVLKDILPANEMKALTSDMIEAVQLSGHEDKLPSKLSGGMKRRAALARAFCYPAELLLMDEPFKGLDDKLKGEMIDLFERLYVHTGKTAIFVTHDLSETKRLGCGVIELGRTVSIAPVF